jgi:hypothetical protein
MYAELAKTEQEIKPVPATCEHCGGDNNLNLHVPACPYETNTETSLQTE